MSDLPVEEAIPALLSALRTRKRAVLEAPPGAGKTTRVPLALHEAGLSDGRIVMLEPRRLAARAAAERMAETLSEPVGATVGYRIRGATKVSKSTRIEVVTEGILTRMLQSDPALDGIGTVIFDEFHERSLNADLGLALTLEAAEALRPDLKLLVMSATLDGGPVAALLGDAPRITSKGRAFPVDTRWLPRPRGDRPLEAATADLVHEALAETEGGLLVFLPGEAEIRRTEARLQGNLPANCVLRPLYGALPFSEQRAAIAPEPAARKIVLATAIAETALTIEDIRVVVDAGRARRARHDPASGMARLVTERVTRAEADQRRGRAGRVAPGVCYRLWTKGEEGALAAFAPAEIERTDLAGLVLELALWGTADPSDLAFLTPPNPGAFAEAQALLRDLGALEGDRITDHGRAMARLPLHPRLAHMLVAAGPPAAGLAALLAAPDPLPRGTPADLALRLTALDQRRDGPFARLRDERRRLAAAAPPGQPQRAAEAAALAYPDRIALRRSGDAPRYLLSGGKGARLDPADPLAGQRLLVATDLDGDPREAKIRRALALSEAALRRVHGDRITWVAECTWSRRDGRVIARQYERFGAITLDERTWRDAPEARLAAAVLDGVRDLGLGALGWSPAARRFRARVALFPNDLPDVSEPHLTDTLEDWLAPFITGCRTAADLRRFDPLEALRARLDWDQHQRLDRLAPALYETPLGRRVAIDYDGAAPEIAVRLQEMFGVTRHPTVGPQNTPLRVTLLSPAGRPVQTTTDLPGFWSTSYRDVRKDMRGRYPKHPWPEDPTTAPPTIRAKPRA